jgi:hypothetical protein
MLYEMWFNSKLSGTEVYYMSFELLLAKIMLCSKRHYQFFLIEKHLI